MKTAVLIESINGGDSILVDDSELTAKINLYNERVYIFAGLAATAENAAMLNELLPELIECSDYDEVQELAREHDLEVESADDLESVKDVLCYFEESKSIGNLNACETCQAYEHMDRGSNYTWHTIGEDSSTTEVAYDDEHGQDLDEWDGSNWYYMHNFNHATKYPIISVDGSEVEEQFLVVEWSQYQGSYTTGKIVGADWTPEDDRPERY